MSTSHFLRSALALALVGCGLAWSAVAHDAWIESRDSGYVVLYGHGDKHEGYAPAKVKAVAAADPPRRNRSPNCTSAPIATPTTKKSPR